MPQRKGSKAPRPAKEEIGEVLDKLYGHDEVIVRTVLQVLARVIREADKQPSSWCWTLTRPASAVLRLNVQTGGADKEAFYIHNEDGEQGNVEFIVDRAEIKKVEETIKSRYPAVTIQRWYSKGAKKDSGRDKVIVPADQLHHLLEIYDLVAQAQAKMIREYATGSATPSNKKEHRPKVLEHMRGYLGDYDIPNPDTRKPEQSGLFEPVAPPITPEQLTTAQQDIESYEAEESASEGAMSKRLVNHYERDKRNRAKAIAIHKTECQVCGFSFEKVYGERGEGYIEVHHIHPISSYKGPVRIDPGEDLAVVCANCHRMIHRKADDPLRIEDLRRIVEEHRRR